MTESKDLYLLQDGTHADPAECERGKDGVLRHKNGLAVCLDANGEPQTVGGDAERNKNVEAAKAGEKPVAAPAEVRRPAPDVTRSVQPAPAAQPAPAQPQPATPPKA